MESLPITDKQLGMIYTKERTTIRVWSPLKDEIYILLYSNGRLVDRKSFLMKKDKDGVHEYVLEGDHKGCFYNFLIDGEEVTDPYSIGSSINSRHSAIIDLKDTDPEGWYNHKIPKGNNFCDAIIYEVHVKDFTGSITSGAKYRGKYLGFVEEGTNYKGLKTGISHLKELGITHVHLLPVYDFYTVNEEKDDFYRNENYNWGYDPELYNVVEGSYATIPEEPTNRIKELKQLIMALHEAGIKVVLDVVYNHTYKNYDSNFNRIMPKYYHRMKPDGTFSDGSGCGNEIASEKPMVRKFILDSLKYWVSEFKVDGFRFDLMALTDMETVEEAVKMLREINPDILIYGEPWAGGSTVMNPDTMPLKGRQSHLNFAFFNDNIRDSIKGDTNGDKKGFVQGESKYKLGVETGIVGSINYDSNHIGFTKQPSQTINYINAHDDLILYDKIKKTLPHMAEEDMVRLNKFGFSILFTAQGIPFIHGGNEFLRTKKMISNTYKSPLSINAIDWSLKEKNVDYYNYFKDLISLRKKYKEFRLKDKKLITDQLKFVYNLEGKNVISYTLSTDDGYLLIIHNGEFYSVEVSKDNLQMHLKNSYNETSMDMNIYPIFNENGLVEEGFNVITDIKIPYFQTNVYEIKK
ncbi:MAG: type I pullulanase [Tissierella sp.]|nr:type I pullulanase [Tissierella sp.]